MIRILWIAIMHHAFSCIANICFICTPSKDIKIGASYAFVAKRECLMRSALMLLDWVASSFPRPLSLPSASLSTQPKHFSTTILPCFTTQIFFHYNAPLVSNSNSLFTTVLSCFTIRTIFQMLSLTSILLYFVGSTI